MVLTSVDSSRLSDLAVELLPKTILHARETVPFYAKKYAGIPCQDLHGLAGLDNLPIVTKRELRDAGCEAVAKGQRIKSVLRTSGTTGVPMLRYHSWEEHEFISAFYNELLENTVEGTARPLVLNIAVPQHGIPFEIPTRAFILTTALVDSELFEAAVETLTETHSIPGVEPRVSWLSSSHSQLLPFTSFVLEKGLTPDRFALSHVQITSRYLTRRLRRVLADAWGARVVDRYGLTEIAGGAFRCSFCGDFHFDPHVVAEVVDLNSKRRLGRGTGALVLSSLYPFAQAQPFIRYWTGDLFEVIPSGCSAIRYRFRGRISHALFDAETSDVLISSAELSDALDAFPEIRRSEAKSVPTIVRDVTAAGNPLVYGTVEQGPPPTYTLSVEVHVTPELFPDWKRELEARIASSILREAPGLQRLVAAGKRCLRVALVAPGSEKRPEHIPEKGFAVWHS